MARRRTRVVIWTAAAVCGFLIASDWPTEVLTGFWASHALFGGVVSGLVLLVIGSLIVERVLTRADANRWQRTSRIAFEELRSSQLTTFRLLELAACGREGAIDVYEHPVEEFEAVVNTVLRENDLHPAGKPHRSLPTLIQDPRWLAAGYEAVRNADSATRVVMARWAPVLIQTDQLYAGLDVVTDANDRMRELRSIMREPARGQRIVDSTTVSALTNAWLETMRSAIAARDALTRLLGRDDWENPAWQALED